MDQFYFEEGYLEVSYFTVIREANSALTFAAALQAQVDIAATTGYYIPDYIAADYFESGVIIEAAADLASVASISITALRIRSATGAFTSAFQQVSSLSDISGTEMTAFTEAAIAVQVSLIRDNNIAASAVFNIATDGRRFRDISATEDSLFDLTAINQRSRATTIETQAAFSLAAANDKLISYSANFAVESTVLAVISHIEGADIIAQNFASLSVTAVKQTENTAGLSAVFQQSANGGRREIASAQLQAFITVLSSRYLGSGRPRTLEANSFSSTAKYGSNSLQGSASTNFPNIVTLPSPKPGQDWVYESYIYPTQSTVTQTDIFDFVNVNFIRVIVYANRTVQVIIRNITGNTISNLFGAVSSAVSVGAWHHICVVKNSSALSFYVDGTRVGTFTASAGWDTYGNASIPYLTERGRDNLFLDESSIAYGTTYGHNPSATTITVPTTARVNDPATTQFLHHWEGNGVDDILVQQFAQAALASTFTLSGRLNGPINVLATLQSTTTLTATINHIEGADLTAFTNAALTATADKIKEAAASTNSNFAVSANVNAITENQISAASEFTQSSIEDRLRDNNISTESIASSLSAVARIAAFFINAEVQSTLTANAVKTANGESTVLSQSTVNAQVVKLAVGTINASSEFAQTTINDRIRDNLSALSTTGNLAIDPNAQFSTNISLSSQFTVVADASGGTIRGIALFMSAGTMTVDAVKITDVQSPQAATADITINTADSLTKTVNANLSSEFVQSAVNSRTRDNQITTESIASELVIIDKTSGNSANLAANTNLAVQGSKTVGVDAALSSSVDIVADNQRTRSYSANLTVVATVVASGRTNKDVAADLSAQITLSAIAVKNSEIFLSAFTNAAATTSADRIRSTQVQVQAQATQQTQITRQRNASANFSAFASNLTAVGKRVNSIAVMNTTAVMIASVNVIHTSVAVYKIPRERRTYLIQVENRSRTIQEETRIYKIRRA